MLGQTRTGAARTALEGMRTALAQRFAASDAAPLDVPHLFVAETLLDLYGEDLRGRAFLFDDPSVDAELCLRPDFTVPVLQAHGAGGWDRAARYRYDGPVFRRQPAGPDRPVEYIQSGIEIIGETDTVRADVDVCAALHGGLSDLGVASPDVTIGDLSILIAVLDALEMPSARRAALRRHLWRPKRFQTLLDRAVDGVALSPEIAALAGRPTETRLDDLVAEAEAVGLRGLDEVSARIDAMAAEAAAPRMPRAERALINAVIAIDGPADRAPERLRTILDGLGDAVTPVLARFEARLEALAAAGLDPASMRFEASFGRNLEYYDGFVFEMRAPGGAVHPPLAGGGRYDAITMRLGAARAVPAVGGIVRPEAVLEVVR